MQLGCFWGKIHGLGGRFNRTLGKVTYIRESFILPQGEPLAGWEHGWGIYPVSSCNMQSGLIEILFSFFLSLLRREFSFPEPNILLCCG